MPGLRFAMLVHVAMTLSTVDGWGMPSDNKTSSLSSNESAITGGADGARARRQLQGWQLQGCNGSCDASCNNVKVCEDSCDRSYDVRPLSFLSCDPTSAAMPTATPTATSAATTAATLSAVTPAATRAATPAATPPATGFFGWSSCEPNKTTRVDSRAPIAPMWLVLSYFILRSQRGAGCGAVSGKI